MDINTQEMDKVFDEIVRELATKCFNLGSLSPDLEVRLRDWMPTLFRVLRDRQGPLDLLKDCNLRQLYSIPATCHVIYGVNNAARNPLNNDILLVYQAAAVLLLRRLPFLLNARTTGYTIASFCTAYPTLANSPDVEYLVKAASTVRVALHVVNRKGQNRCVAHISRVLEGMNGHRATGKTENPIVKAVKAIYVQESGIVPSNHGRALRQICHPQPGDVTRCIPDPSRDGRFATVQSLVGQNFTLHAMTTLESIKDEHGTIIEMQPLNSVYRIEKTDRSSYSDAYVPSSASAAAAVAVNDASVPVASEREHTLLFRSLSTPDEDIVQSVYNQLEDQSEGSKTLVSCGDDSEAEEYHDIDIGDFFGEDAVEDAVEDAIEGDLHTVEATLDGVRAQRSFISPSALGSTNSYTAGLNSTDWSDWSMKRSGSDIVWEFDENGDKTMFRHLESIFGSTRKRKRSESSRDNAPASASAAAGAGTGAGAGAGAGGSESSEVDSSRPARTFVPLARNDPTNRYWDEFYAKRNADKETK